MARRDRAAHDDVHAARSTSKTSLPDGGTAGTVRPALDARTRARESDHGREAAPRGVRQARDQEGQDRRLRLDGVLRGKYVSLDKFWSAVEGGLGFCDVIFGWDIGDVLYDNARVTGWHTGYPDTHATIDLDTFRVLPWEQDTAAFLVDFVHEDGTPHAACPRSLLKRILARAKALGLSATFACEFEFFIFKETSESLHQKGFRGLTPLSPGMFGYSWVREGQNSELCHAILDDMEAFDIPIEGLHTETGPGVYEVAIRYDEALRMADKAALFKTAMKQVCFEREPLVHVHGEVERGAPRLERAPAPVALEGGDERLLRRERPELAQRDGEELPRRPGRADARADRALCADGERVQALRPRRVGAAHRVVGDREPHLRDPDDRRAA